MPNEVHEGSPITGKQLALPDYVPDHNSLTGLQGLCALGTRLAMDLG